MPLVPQRTVLTTKPSTNGYHDFSPFWCPTDQETVRLYLGDVVSVLRKLPSKSVQCVITSPPYWGLRDYGHGGQIGSEKTPQEFVAKMVEVFREIHRVLRDDGTVWLNLGDTYAGSSMTGGSHGLENGRGEERMFQKDTFKGLASGNLVGVPWRVALALQADGWVLRQDLIWAKPSPMPESVKNRCTKAHEYVFLLTKSMNYFYDAEAIKEPGGGHRTGGAMNYRVSEDGDGRDYQSQNRSTQYVLSNKRSVWRVSSQGYAGAHFATFPPKLIEPMILAGTSEKGACVECGAPWKRVIEERRSCGTDPNEYVKRNGQEGTGSSCANSVAGVETKTVGWEPTCICHGRFEKQKIRTLVGSPKASGRKVDGCEDDGVEPDVRNRDGKSWAAWQVAEHGDEDYREVTALVYVSDLPLDEHPVRPCLVLDPFIGSGTTCCVSIEHGRWSWGIDISEKYLRENAVPRIEGELLARPGLVGLVPLRGDRAPLDPIAGKELSLLG